jgi:hypothetical protein
MMFSLRNLLIVLLLGTINVALADNEREMNEDLNQQFTVVNGCYTPRDVHIGVLECEYYLYFMIDSTGTPTQLLLHVQYCADDPLDFDQLLFTIDGYNYPYYPVNHQSGTLDGGLYWEMSDDVLQPAYKDLVYALAHGHWVAIKFMSTRGIHHVKMLTEGQIEDFSHALDLYRLVGGEI